MSIPQANKTDADPSGSNRQLEMVPPSRLVTDTRNSRTHSQQQIDQIARSIKRFGFLGAILIDDRNQIVAGHGRVEAAKQLGLIHVPVLRVTHLSDAERRAYAIADNRLAELAGWDDEILAIELGELRELDFDLAAIGFELADVEIVGNENEKTGTQSAAPKTDRGTGTSDRPVSGAGDVWLLGPHQLRCADTDEDEAYAAVDAAIQRWQRVAGTAAMLAGVGKTFAEIRKERASTAIRHAATNQEAA
jgi:ParB-like nuclease domain